MAEKFINMMRNIYRANRRHILKKETNTYVILKLLTLKTKEKHVFLKVRGKKKTCCFQKRNKKTDKGFLRESRSRKSKKSNHLITKNIYPST